MGDCALLLASLGGLKSLPRVVCRISAWTHTHHPFSIPMLGASPFRWEEGSREKARMYMVGVRRFVRILEIQLKRYGVAYELGGCLAGCARTARLKLRSSPGGE